LSRRRSSGLMAVAAALCQSQWPSGRRAAGRGQRCCSRRHMDVTVSWHTAERSTRLPAAIGIWPSPMSQWSHRPHPPSVWMRAIRDRDTISHCASRRTSDTTELDRVSARPTRTIAWSVSFGHQSVRRQIPKFTPRPLRLSVCLSARPAARRPFISFHCGAAHCSDKQIHTLLAAPVAHTSQPHTDSEQCRADQRFQPATTG